MTESFILTEIRSAALIDALVHGSIWKRSRSTVGNWGSRYHAPVTIKKLVDAGLIEYRMSTSPIYAGGYELTAQGRVTALRLPDEESSASRQHFIDTGKYLTYGDREEFNPPKFSMGDVVQSNIFDETTQYEIVGMAYGDRTWFYDVKVMKDDQEDYVVYSVVINPEFYHVVEQEPVERDWELLAPAAAQAATLVALGRGDEVVEDYADGVITALELLAELVEAGR